VDNSPEMVRSHASVCAFVLGATGS
jgi:hypothetical protein